MTRHCIHVGIIDYPGAMQSAVQGFKEMFFLANIICQQQKVRQSFSVAIANTESIERSMTSLKPEQQLSALQIVLIPPNISGQYYLAPAQSLKNWILRHHSQGAVICSACAGAFILANTGLLNNRPATTHWKLTSLFTGEYPDTLLDINKILINDGDLITAAGLMSWVDLGLELVAQFTRPVIMRKLGRHLIVDTGLREQRYYLSFSPKLDHGDAAILKVQHYLYQHFPKPLTIATLAAISFLSDRTFLRRFVKATGFKPTHYIQKLRMQKACDLIETSHKTFELIAQKVGYEDTSAFRKIFLRTVGLSPREFKNRFCRN